MAKSGSFQTKFATGYALRIGWNIDSQDIAKNTSAVTVTMYLVSLGSKYEIISNYSKEVSLTINGTTYNSTASSATLSPNEVKTLATKTITVTHDVEGKASITLSGSFGVKATLGGTYYRYIYAPESGTQTVELETIPRVTTPTTSGTFNVGSAVTISTPRASDSFTHTLQYSLNNSTWTNIATGVTTSHSWTLPSALATAKPNAKTGTVYIRCITYSGSTNIGEKVISRTYNITSGYASPSVALTIAQSNAASIAQYIRGKSTVTLTATATLKYSATATQYVFTYGSETKTVTTTETSASVTFALPTDAAESFAYSVVLTDSRGYTASKSGTVTTVAYAAPKITSFTVTRGDGTTSSTFVESNTGKSLKVVIKGTVSSVANANAKNYKVDYCLTSDGSYTALLSSRAASAYSFTATHYTSAIFDADSTYALRVTLTDSFASTEANANVSTKRVMMNFSADGEHMGIGELSEETKPLTVGFKTHFHNRDGTGNEAVVIDAPSAAEGSILYRQAQAKKWAHGVGLDGGATASSFVLWNYDKGTYAFYVASGSNGFHFNGDCYIPTVQIQNPSSVLPSARFYVPEVSKNVGVIQFNGNEGQRRFLIYQYHEDQNEATTRYYDGYQFPKTTAGKTQNDWYDILTSKNPVTVAQGGTGAKTAADARTKLGAAAKEHTHEAADIVEPEWAYPTLTNGTTPASVGSKLRYKKIGNHVYVTGSVQVKPASSSVALFTFPTGYRPLGNTYKLAAMGGQRIARLYVNASGVFNVEWAVDISNGSSYTNENWVDCTFDFWTT